MIQGILAFTPEKASGLSAYEPLVVLAAAFPTRQMPFPFAGNCCNAGDYWAGRPKPLDAEGLYELNDDWRAWTFEVRFSQGQSIDARVAWCGDESVMAALRRLQDEQVSTPRGDPPTASDRFLQRPPALEPAGTPEFCQRVEQWVREEVGL